MSCPSSIRRRDSKPRPLERESTPITTRPGHIFLYFRLFNTVDSRYKGLGLLRTGFEPWTSGVGSDHTLPTEPQPLTKPQHFLCLWRRIGSDSCDTFVACKFIKINNNIPQIVNKDILLYFTVACL